MTEPLTPADIASAQATLDAARAQRDALAVAAYERAAGNPFVQARLVTDPRFREAILSRPRPELCPGVPVTPAQHAALERANGLRSTNPFAAARIVSSAFPVRR